VQSSSILLTKFWLPMFWLLRNAHVLTAKESKLQMNVLSQAIVFMHYVALLCNRPEGSSQRYPCITWLCNLDLRQMKLALLVCIQWNMMCVRAYQWVAVCEIIMWRRLQNIQYRTRLPNPSFLGGTLKIICQVQRNTFVWKHSQQ